MADGKQVAESRQLFAAYGKTFEVNMMGKRVVHTMDMQNNQTTTALEVGKFGVEPLYKPAAAEWMGNSSLLKIF